MFNTCLLLNTHDVKATHAWQLFEFSEYAKEKCWCSTNCSLSALSMSGGCLAELSLLVCVQQSGHCCYRYVRYKLVQSSIIMSASKVNAFLSCHSFLNVTFGNRCKNICVHQEEDLNWFSICKAYHSQLAWRTFCFRPFPFTLSRLKLSSGLGTIKYIALCSSRGGEERKGKGG